MMVSDELSLVYHDAMPLLFLDIIDQRAVKSRQRIGGHLQSMGIISYLRLIDIKTWVFLPKLSPQLEFDRGNGS